MRTLEIAADAVRVARRVYAFIVDETGLPIELDSDRFAKAYLGERIRGYLKLVLLRTD